ncbi:unnamed protein product [Urochloa humidicola]
MWCATTRTRLFFASCHIQLAVRNDEGQSKLLQVVTITAGGVLQPNIHRMLLHKKAGDKGKPALNPHPRSSEAAPCWFAAR